MMFLRLTFLRAALAASLLASLITAASPAAAQKEWVVYSFPADESQGIIPYGNLVSDNAGNLYGTTEEFGASGWGTVYELVRPVPPKTKWTENVLHSFGAGADGRPFGGLVFDDVGNLYGTTEGSGGSNEAVVFELSPPTIAGSAWTESVLHTFSAATEGIPQALIRDVGGSLYGITERGSAIQDSGCDSGCGTVFQLSPPETPGGVWTETILHSFVSAHGAEPLDGSVFDSQGNLYGSTFLGGKFGTGVIYRLLRPATAGGTWTYKVLHSFGAITTGSPEGAGPVGGLTLHGKRVIYGTTHHGGLYGLGTVFQLVPPTAASGPWTENVLYSFEAGQSDGSHPGSKVMFDSAGNIYGTTEDGGPGALGTVFELSPPASDGPWTETVLHSFHGKDGAYPGGGLIFGKNGVLFGTTQSGGTGGGGAVFGILP